MNIVDVFIVLFFITALMRGIELGVVRQVCSTAGLLAGLFLGAYAQGKLIHLAERPASKAMLAFIAILIGIAIFSTIGDYVGAALKARVERTKFKLIGTADKAAGSAVAGITLLLAVWLGAAIFSSTPIEGLQKQIHNSVIVAQLNKSLPPAPDVVAKLGHLINPNDFPDVFTGLEPRVDTTAPLPSIGELDAAVQQARTSVVKVEGGGCGGISQGSGFVAGSSLVITNAHVVAGVENPYVVDANGRHTAQVVWFDSALDMAVLRTNNLAGQALDMESGVAGAGTSGAILGYPGGKTFTAMPATVLDSFSAVGRNIYNQGKTERQVYSVKGEISPGNSGGPLIDNDGDVIGLIFAESTTYDNVGYALTMDAVIDGFGLAKDRTQAVSTGGCTQ